MAFSLARDSPIDPALARIIEAWPALPSIDPDEVTKQAVEKYDLPQGQEPTEKQLQQVEHERMREALKPFHNPKLRKTILGAKQSLEQVIDEQTGWLGFHSST